jgi:hypothetical protein
VNCASSGVILTKIEATTARESPLSMTLAAEVFQTRQVPRRKMSKFQILSLRHSCSLQNTILSISVHVGQYHEGGSLCEPVLSHSWFSSIEVVGGRGSVHTIFGSISVRSAFLGSSWLSSSFPYS